MTQQPPLHDPAAALREWQLGPTDPMAPRFAADARAGRTVPADDQTWQLRLGGPSEPAIALETRYGGRVGLARVVPAWLIGRRTVLETQGYHAPPVLTAFTPDYCCVRAGLTAALALTVEVWVMESQAIGGRFMLHNRGETPQRARLDLSAQAARENDALQVFLLTLENNAAALQLGRLPGLQPVLLLEGAQPMGATRAQLCSTLPEIAPGATASVRWVLAGLPNRDDSLLLAHQWLSAPDWDAHFATIARRAAAVPQIATGDTDWDLALAWSQQLILRCFLPASDHLPHASFVSARKTSTGYSGTGAHASGFTYAWGGQSLPDALTIAGAVALAAPELAQGVVRNFLAVQREDGWIDARPGLDGQRTGVLAPPLLAALAHTVYRFTGDKEFLAACLDGLVALFFRWANPPGGDVDADGDGAPEWQDVQQGAFDQGPLFAQSRTWSQGIDPRMIETPDLVALLLHEGRLILQIAEAVGRRAAFEAEIAPVLERLGTALESFWDEAAGAYRPRDRDSHVTTGGTLVFAGKGDETIAVRTALPEPGRLILRVTGGLGRKPAMECAIEGTDIAGNPAHETVPAGAFDWYRGGGTATTRTAWSAITHLRFSGLSRVFKIEARTADLTHPDLGWFVPLITGALPDDRAARLVAALTDPAQYWRAHGLAGVPANRAPYDPLHREGPGGCWPEWNARLGLALLRRGYAAESVALFRRVIGAQAAILRREQTFRRYWSPDTGEGLGDAEVIQGTVSVEWFAELFGAFVRDARTVVITGPYRFGDAPMTWMQHGVMITRDGAGATIAFPSGHRVALPPDAEPQVLRDPTAPPAPRSMPRPPADDDLVPDGT